MKKIILGLAISLFACTAAIGQDFTSSMHYFNRIYFNPAYAGFDDASRLTINHRQQWPGVPIFIASSLIWEGQLPRKRENSNVRSGFAVSYNNDVQGEGFLMSHQLKGVGTVMFVDEKNRLSFGLAASRVWKNINWDRLVFSDQIHPVLGIIKNISDAAPVGFNYKAYLDFDAGFVYRRSMDWGVASVAASVSHIGSPYESLLQTGERLKPRANLSVQSMFSIGRASYLAPSIRLERQGKQQAFVLGTYVIPYVNPRPKATDPDGSVFFGAWFRHGTFPGFGKELRNFDSAIASFGYQSGYKKKDERMDRAGNRRKEDWLSTRFQYWQIAASYDFTVSKLGNANTGGTFEISLVLGTTAKTVYCAVPSSKGKGSNLLSLPSAY